MKDPWRHVEPLHPKARPARDPGERINLEDIDLDADLAIPGRWVIRSEHACFDVVHVKVERPIDALRLLAQCILEIGAIKAVAAALTGAGIGAKAAGRKVNEPAADMPASQLAGDGVAVWFVQKPLDQGMLLLARILRSPAVAPIVRKHGITVMLKA